MQLVRTTRRHLVRTRAKHRDRRDRAAQAAHGTIAKGDLLYLLDTSPVKARIPDVRLRIALAHAIRDRDADFRVEVHTWMRRPRLDLSLLALAVAAGMTTHEIWRHRRGYQRFDEPALRVLAAMRG